MFLATVVSYLVFVLAAQRALAANDWSVPCLQYQCSWDLPTDSGASGTVYIWGSPNVISDITVAAGWHIMSCDPTATIQAIQLVCQNSNLGCDHLFQGSGVNTIVRLPENCGPIPFARVASHQILQEDSGVSGTVVHALTLDVDFGAATVSQFGVVQFSLQGINTNSPLNVRAPARRGYKSVRTLGSPRDRLHRRNFLAHGIHALREAEASNETNSENAKPVDYSGGKTLFNTSIEWPAGVVTPIFSSASVSLDVSANVQVAISIGVVAAGTLIPPNISDLRVGLDGNIDASLRIIADNSRQISSGDITPFQVGIPGLNFPGILELGPEFELVSRIDATFGLTDIEADFELSFDLSGVGLVFPPQVSSQVGTFTPGSNQLTLSAIPGTGASFEATGHLIPQFEIALVVLGGIVSTSVFLNLNASADFAVITSVESCVTASTVLNVEVGAQSSFFDLFDASVGVSLFNRSFPLLQQCLAAPNTSRNMSTVALTNGTQSQAGPSPRAERYIYGGSILPLHAKRSDLDLNCHSAPNATAMKKRTM
ncbi:hypothetical protein BC827DRAFT_1272621 [Russula dissimulans]|nr:hypothetical protein BC827DRAFT_1272621 [Russula dissimulans]